MTNPITEPTQSIQERLARALHRTYNNRQPFDSRVSKYLLPKVDAILSELMEPSEGMIAAFDKALCCVPAGDETPDEVIAWQAMIQHILSGGK